MSESYTTIAYVGKKVEDGTMDVRDLGPALLAIGKICEQAHKVIDKDSKGVSVLVKRISAGSFEIHLSLTVSLVEQTKNLFEVSGYNSAIYILNLIGLGVEEFVKELGKGLGIFTAVVIYEKISSDDRWTLIKFLRFLKKRTPFEIADKKNGVEITVKDKTENQSALIPKDIWNLYKDKKTRKYLYAIMLPLEQKEIDFLEVRDKKNNKVTEKIAKEELPYFASHQEEENIETETTKNRLLRIDSPQMTDPDKKRWFFSVVEEGGDKSFKFSASIKDEDYLEKVLKGEIIFKRGVRIRATLIARHSTQDGREKNEYELHDIKHDPDNFLQKEIF